LVVYISILKVIMYINIRPEDYEYFV